MGNSCRWAGTEVVEKEPPIKRREQQVATQEEGRRRESRVCTKYKPGEGETVCRKERGGHGKAGMVRRCGEGELHRNGRNYTRRGGKERRCVCGGKGGRDKGRAQRVEANTTWLGEGRAGI